ncbi:hypothetical protein [Caenimonas aquaedulcis]|uniref:Transmembrane protein n=1 Tax=Caenimonas aquaedulcis TaxID=2793270 RepID=A0A931H6K3_9BURK|nr:hypothetical protein [Caenimonas aquaedulcis]MBG9389531.1 hypothetical protein [Caenimonas aquaedulcis]
MHDEPLGLTIHSLPVPQDAAAHDAQRTVRGRWRMLAVMLVCAAPVIASYLTYYVIRPSAQRSYGELIDPQRPLPDAPGMKLDGSTIALPSLKGQWLLVSVAGGACDALCERHLYLQRQLRESLGKDKERLDWIWLVPDQTPVREALRPALAQATVLRVDAQQLAAWLAPAAGHRLEDHMYLVDPLGHWMMRFPATSAAGAIDTAAAAKVKRDVERVLRASASWDQAGRPVRP